MTPLPTTPLTLRLDRYDHNEAFVFRKDKQPTTPSEWFSKMFPTATLRFGTPCLERRYCSDGFSFTDIEMLNDNFFAAVLGGDDRLHHKVVYYIPEATFYFRDIDNNFHPTEETKLTILHSSLFVRCAEEVPTTVNRRSLFQFANDTNHLKGIVRKARSILAADRSFFSPESSHRRVEVEGPDTNAQVTRIFVENNVQPKADEKMTVQQTYEAFQQYCQQHGLVVVDRRAFKQLIEEIIREQYGIGPRNDIKDPQGGCKRGWSGLTLKSRLELAG